MSLELLFLIFNEYLIIRESLEEQHVKIVP